MVETEEVQQKQDVQKGGQFKQDDFEQLWDENGFIMWARQARRDQFFVRVSGQLDMTPMQTFRVFTNPDNSKVFRDVESIVSRKVLQSDSDVKVVEVKQRARWRILFFQGFMVSHLIVKEEPRKGKINFRLAQPGLMKKWEGEWRLVNDGKNGTKVSLHLEVSPSFVPPFLTGLLRALTSGSTKRFIQDVQKVDRLFQQGGRTLDEILGNIDGVEEWCDPSQTSSCPEVKSFEIDFEDELIDGEFIEILEQEKQKWWQKLKSKITREKKEKNDKNGEKVIQERQIVNQERQKINSEKKRAKLERKLLKKESKRVLKERKQSLKNEKKSPSKKRSKEEKKQEKLLKKITRAESKRLKKENKMTQQEL
eukprot:TRINITY_DN7138_c0_g2_i1.p1 TRINITY_DN7138_c0_g2~~TRINITY_DN7138_c0_g2_i1.p1  ORF type:complete len:391 (+),score=65.27 TRINITY_DN7138_c0_g2_i1:77-1174(+)